MAIRVRCHEAVTLNREGKVSTGLSKVKVLLSEDDFSSTMMLKPVVRFEE